MARNPLKLDWNKLLPNGKNDPPEEIEIIEVQTPRENVELLLDHQLEEKIKRIRSFIEGNGLLRLPDKGFRLKVSLQSCEEEREKRRNINMLIKDVDQNRNSMQCQSTKLVGPVCDPLVLAPCGQKLISSLPHKDASRKLDENIPKSDSTLQSSFAIRFSQQLEGKPISVKHLATKAFEDDFRMLGQRNCNGSRSSNTLTKKESQISKVPSRRDEFRSPYSLSINEDSARDPVLYSKSNVSSTQIHPREQLSSLTDKKHTRHKISNYKKIKKTQSFVDLDEDDTRSPAEGRIKVAKIYYPSRNVPEAVELCYSDLECLSPESFLSSPVMNFYIQYLQRPMACRGRSDDSYHIFNTYFYKKLEEAVSCRMNDKDTLFNKFRRWWKGVDLFQKSYIFLPIHAEEHWSLVIVCVPSKEDELGPTILHLDSLGYHASNPIFEKVGRDGIYNAFLKECGAPFFLKEEWNYLNQHDNIRTPLAEKIWRHLPRRIMRKVIAVPQQNNVYDCGVFVLYFLERFLEEAPETVTKIDLDKFGKKWFNPNDASGLRKRLRELLLEEFHNAGLETESTTTSGSSSDEDYVEPT